jgi:hypothetical protein
LSRYFLSHGPLKSVFFLFFPSLKIADVPRQRI